MARSNSLDLDLSMRQVQKLSLSLDVLDPGDRDKLLLAEQFWREKEHYTSKVPLIILQDVLLSHFQNAGKATKALVPLEFCSKTMSEDFVFLTPEELAELDPNEKYGLKLGDYIFICNATPDEYIPLVVLNLAVLRYLNDDNFLTSMLQNAAIDIDESRHWTANIIDILVAKTYFQSSQDALDDYMIWRKKAELTEFFYSDLVNDILRRRAERRNYRRTTSPLLRGRYCRFSWMAAKDLDFYLGEEYADKVYRDFGVSRCDLLFKRMMKGKDFNPEKMMRLLNFLQQEMKQYKVNGRLVRYIDVTNELDSQAFLLSDYEAGEAGILTRDKDNCLRYYAKTFIKTTIEAMINKLSYFYRTALLNQREKGSDVSLEILSFLKDTKGVFEIDDQTLGIKRIKIDVITPENAEETFASIKRCQDRVSNRISELGNVLNSFAQIQSKLDQYAQSGISTMPASFEHDRNKVLEEIQRLEILKKQFFDLHLLLHELVAARRQAQALLEAAVFDEKDQRLLANPTN